MKNEYKLVALLAVMLVGLAAMSAALAEPSDAQSNEGVVAGHPYVDSAFKDNSKGTVKLTVGNNSGDMTYWVFAAAEENGKQLAVSGDYQEITHGTQITLSISFKLSSGTHNISVIVYYKDSPEGGQNTITQSMTIDSQKTIWSGQLPYVAIVIVALIIAAMIFIWMRGRPKAQPAVTFSDLEEGKTAEAPAPAAATRQKYSSESSEDSGPVKYKSFRRK